MGRARVGDFRHGLAELGRKRGLQTDLQKEIIQEIETFLGRQSIADLDFQAVEMAARRRALRLPARALEQRLNDDTSDFVGPDYPAPAEAPPNAVADTVKASRVSAIPCC